MAVEKSLNVPIRSPEMSSWCARRCGNRAVEIGFSLVDQTKIVTAASELARNTAIYGGGGTVRIESLNDGSRTGLRLTFEDHGPGIPDLSQAMQDGYTSGSGLGLGLGGARAAVQRIRYRSRARQRHPRGHHRDGED